MGTGLTRALCTALQMRPGSAKPQPAPRCTCGLVLDRALWIGESHRPGLLVRDWSTGKVVDQLPTGGAPVLCLAASAIPDTR